MMIVSLPFEEIIGNIESPRIDARILEIAAEKTFLVIYL